MFDVEYQQLLTVKKSVLQKVKIRMGLHKNQYLFQSQ